MLSGSLAGSRELVAVDSAAFWIYRLREVWLRLSRELSR